MTKLLMQAKRASLWMVFSLFWMTPGQAFPKTAEPRARITLELIRNDILVQIKNTQTQALQTVRVEYLFDNVNSKINFSRSVKSFDTAQLKIPLSRPKYAGSYTFRLRLYFLKKDGRTKSVQKVQMVDFGRKARLRLPLLVESDYIFRKSTLFVRGMPDAKLHKLRYHFTDGITIASKTFSPGKVRLDLKQAVVFHGSLIPVAVTYDTLDTVNGQKVHFAGKKVFFVKNGEYLHYKSETIKQVIVTLVLIVLILIATVLIRRKQREKESGRAVLFGGIILTLAMLLIFTAYSLPARRIFDEAYHVTLAEKHLQGIFLMHPHPPLSRLMIALGEFLLNPNPDIPKSVFLSADAVLTFPIGYSYLGIRLFPVLFGVLSAFVFFLLLYDISKKSWIAFLFSSFFLLDNAVIAHCRFALPESAQIFFILLSLLFFVRALNKSAFGPKEFLTLGVYVGLAVSVKYNSLILCVLFVVLVVREFNGSSDNIKDYLLKKFPKRASAAVLGMALPIVLVWYVHTGLGMKIMHQKVYGGSKTLINEVKQGRSWNPLILPVSIWDNTNFIFKFHRSIKPVNVSDEKEIGSRPVGWPIGHKAIRYRITRPDRRGKRRYLYLHGNPLLWFIGLCSVFVGIWVCIQGFFLNKKIRVNKYFPYIAALTFMYLFYMVTMMNIRRLMYLYHYLIPLVFAYLLCFCLFNFYYDDAREKVRKGIRKGLLAVVLCVLALFVFFAPFTYHVPISKSEFSARNWFSFWGLKSD